MNPASAYPAAVPFFLDAAPGKRFCLYHPPHHDASCRGALIYVHPFAEEMNKSRRMAALQARELAASGYAVLLIDLFGCGDSSGDFADARWSIWKQDLIVAHAWLRRKVQAPVGLWGLRLGALLALDFAAEYPDMVRCLLLWQPVLRGEVFLTQFLRLQLAGDLLAGQTQAESGTRSLRNKLHAGDQIEIAGYVLPSSLARAIDEADVAKFSPPRCPVHWYELTQSADRPLPIPAARIIETWRENAVQLTLQQVQCPAFWLSQEIVESPELISATIASLSDRSI
jgi:exosortase A-associated hydrolase 2